MNVKIKQKTLLNALKQCKKGVKKRGPEKNQMIRLNVQENIMHISVHNEEFSLYVNNINCVSNCSFCIDLMFDDIYTMSECNSECISLEYFKDNNKLIIKSDNSTNVLYDVYESEKQDTFKSNNFIEFDIQELKNAIDKVIPFISTDKDREVQSIHYAIFESYDRQLNVVGLDGYRLGKYITSARYHKEDRILVHINVLKLLKSLITKKHIGRATLIYNDDTFYFSFNNILVKANMVNYNIIDYKKLIPKEASTVCKCDTNGILNSLKVLMNNKIKNYTTSLNLSHNNFNISSMDNNITYDYKVIEFKGEDMKLYASAKFLYDTFNVLSSDIVTISVNRNIDPIIIHDNVSSFLALVLPIKCVYN